MSTTYQEKEYARGFVGKIVFDDYAEAPDFETLGEIAYLKRSRYKLGTEAVSEERMDEIARGINQGDLIGAPIYAYVHSGATIRIGQPFACLWDSGQSGFVYCTKERAIEWCGSVEAALECLAHDVKTFDAYLTGDVVGWVLEDESGNVVDSCYGYYGLDDNLNGMLSELDHAAKCQIEELEQDERKAAEAEEVESAESLYWAQRDVVTRAIAY